MKFRNTRTSTINAKVPNIHDVSGWAFTNQKEMNTKELKVVLSKIEKAKEKIAKERDVLRELYDDLESLLDSFDRGIEAIENGKLEIENGIDAISEVV